MRDKDAQLMMEAYLHEDLKLDPKTQEPQPVGLSGAGLTSWVNTTKHLKEFTRTWMDENKERIKYLNEDEIQVLVLAAYKEDYPSLWQTVTDEVKIWVRWWIQTIIWIFMTVGKKQQDVKDIGNTGEDDAR